MAEETESKMIKCWFCAEEILPDAKKCKHCGEWVKPQKNDGFKTSKEVVNPLTIKDKKDKDFSKVLNFFSQKNNLLTFFMILIIFIGTLSFISIKSEINKKRIEQETLALQEAHKSRHIAIKVTTFYYVPPVKEGEQSSPDEEIFSGSYGDLNGTHSIEALAPKTYEINSDNIVSAVFQKSYKNIYYDDVVYFLKVQIFVDGKEVNSQETSAKDGVVSLSYRVN
jgi:hypothetical protein